MTIKELYEWAIKNKCENKIIKVPITTITNKLSNPLYDEATMFDVRNNSIYIC